MPTIPSQVYTKDYYLSDCSDFETYQRSGGEKLGLRLKEIISRIPFQKNERVLDIGCGRGEVLLHCLKKGVEVIGIDYAEAATRLTSRKKVIVLQANAKKLPFMDSSFGKVLLFDVVEHLYPKELEQMMKEIRRVLKPKGSIFIHTAPNKILVDWVFPYWIRPWDWLLITLSNFLSGKNYSKLPVSLRSKSNKLMHINEMTYWKLKHLLKSHGFSFQFTFKHFCLKPCYSWKDKVYNMIVGLYPLALKRPLIWLFTNQFFIAAKKR